MWNPSTCDCTYNKAYKNGKYMDDKNGLWEKRLIGKLVLACKDKTVKVWQSKILATKKLVV